MALPPWVHILVVTIVWAALMAYSKWVLFCSVPAMLFIWPLYKDFEAWTCAGTGGTPATLRGYLRIYRWAFYVWWRSGPQLDDVSPIPDEGEQYLDEKNITIRLSDINAAFPVSNIGRIPPRPRLMPWILPQRQSDSKGDPNAFAIVHKIFQDYATQFADTFVAGPSRTEGGTGSALYVKADVPSINPHAKDIFYEIAHIHPEDMSLHIYLSPRDARLVITRGWGLRFPVDWIAPASWTFIYAPRNDKEIELVCYILDVACCFAAGKRVRWSAGDEIGGHKVRGGQRSSSV